ncbi:phosphonate ABC transporter ATP-binding protein [Ilumatobacter coccineus]|jgi:phosphonate transport system ATP-binding protein|uniref:phosphonate ABC transporter ATP-binding protein n=1 Tax=Ilumatobacter coccineus TaxID=467094 RepID=UPI00034BD869|nr:ATP-binding cassette domain-containing protein [Ilumatobacter coccineus]
MPASSADQAALRLTAVTVDYVVGSNTAGVRALHEVDLTIAPGERVALLGESGAGKSTLLDVVAGLTVPTSGSVEVLGAAIDELRGRALRRHRADIGVVRQQHGLPESLRVVHNVNAGRLGTWSTWRALTSLVRPRGRAEVDSALAAVGLAGLADRLTGDLSGGQQQRVAVARALIEQRRLLLADEPVSAVDPKLSDDVLRLLRAADGDPAVLVSLHDPGLARRHVDRIVGLRDGIVHFDLPVDEVSDRRIDDLYRITPSG